MSKKKPDTLMAEKLKAVADRLAADAVAQKKAEEEARAEQARRKTLEADAKEAALGDDERFLRAMGVLSPRETARKFDMRPPEPAGPPASDEDLFLEALGQKKKK